MKARGININQIFPIFEVKQDTATSISKETLIKYLEYSIGYDNDTNNYIGNINDLTHLYYGLIGGYIPFLCKARSKNTCPSVIYPDRSGIG